MGKNKSYHQLLHSFCLNPSLKFDGQETDEFPILVVRAHPITQISWIIKGFFLLFFIFGLNIFLSYYLKLYQIIFVNFFGLCFVFGYWYFNFLQWFFNVGIITNKRILDVDFYGLMYKETTIAILSKVEDITTKSSGFFPSFFNYGNVFIQTAGAEVNIEFINIPKPQEVAKVINQLLKDGKSSYF